MKIWVISCSVLLIFSCIINCEVVYGSTVPPTTTYENNRNCHGVTNSASSIYFGENDDVHYIGPNPLPLVIPTLAEINTCAELISFPTFTKNSNGATCTYSQGSALSQNEYNPQGQIHYTPDIYANYQCSDGTESYRRVGFILHESIPNIVCDTPGFPNEIYHANGTVWECGEPHQCNKPEISNCPTIGDGGNQHRVEVAEMFNLQYKSIPEVDYSSCTIEQPDARTRFDGEWTHNYSNKLERHNDLEPVIISIHSGSNDYVFTAGSNDSWMGSASQQAELENVTDEQQNLIGYKLNKINDTSEYYSLDGLLTTIQYRNGTETNLDYNTQDQLVEITDQFNNSTQLGYDANGNLITITDSNNAVTTLEYDTTGKVIKIIFPDDTPETNDNPYTEFVYNDQNNSNLITNVFNESGAEIKSWSYDALGRLSSEIILDNIVNKIYTYNSNGTTTVTNSLGKNNIYHFETYDGVKKVTLVEGLPTASCAGANQQRVYDSNGFLVSKIDWNGIETTYIRNSKGQEISRTEAVGTSEERTITTEWHQTFNLPINISDSTQSISFTYDNNTGSLLSKTVSDLTGDNSGGENDDDIVNPIVTILSPSDGDVLNGTDVITFTATAIDERDGDISENIRWFTSSEAYLGQGASINVTLDEGEYGIIALANDASGNYSESEIEITVTNIVETAVITIHSPVDNAEFTTRDNVLFNAIATFEESNISNELEWSSDIDGVLGVGPSINVSLTEGVHIISAYIPCEGGGECDEYVVENITLTITAVASPTLSIISPENNSRYIASESITLSASAYLGTENISNLVVWYSAVDGSLGVGATIEVQLSENTHFILASVCPEGGEECDEVEYAEDSLTITVVAANTAPTVSITSPTDGTQFNNAQSINFVGTAMDAEDGSLSTNIAWASNLDGELGSGASISNILSVGSHQITASVTDANGLAYTEIVNVTVVAANTAPTISITSPTDGTSFNINESINLTGIANDNEDGDVSSGITWSSNIDGVLGSGTAISTMLTQGSHVITASIADSNNQVETAILNLIITNTATGPATSATLASNHDSLVSAGTLVTLVADATGGSGNYEYRFEYLGSDGYWTLFQDYSSSATFVWDTSSFNGEYQIRVAARNADSQDMAVISDLIYHTVNSAGAATAVTLSANYDSPINAGTLVTLVAAATGGSGNYEYRFEYLGSDGYWTLLQDYSSSATFVWDTSSYNGEYQIRAAARNAGSQDMAVISDLIYQTVNSSVSATAVTLSANHDSPISAGSLVTLAAAATGGSGNYEYLFEQYHDGQWTVIRDFSTSSTFTWDTTSENGFYILRAHARNAGTQDEAVISEDMYRNINSADAATAVTLSANHDSPISAGSLVTLAAAATGGSGNYEYLFEQYHDGQWTVIRDFSTSSTFTWDTTSENGFYILRAHARNAGTQDEAVISEDMYRNINSADAATAVTLSANHDSPISAGSLVTLAAAATGGSGNYEYLFEQYHDGQWTVIRDFSTSSTFTWDTTSENGFYILRAHARNAGTQDEAVISEDMYRNINSADAATAVTLSANHDSPISAGSLVTLAAAATGGSGNYEYLFEQYHDGQWTVIRDFSTSSTFTWDTTSENGFYILRAHARNAGTQDEAVISEDMYRNINSADAATAVTLSANHDSPISAGSLVTLAAAATGGSGNYEYLFEQYHDGQWTVIRDFSTSSTFTWDTTSENGFYILRAHARNAGTQDEAVISEDMYSTVD